MAKPSRPTLTWSRRILLFLLVLSGCLLICLWRCNHSVSADDGALHYTQQPVVEVEVTLDSSAAVRKLRGLGYECDPTDCRLELPDGDEVRLAGLGFTVRPLARAIRVELAPPQEQMAAALQEHYAFGRNDSVYYMPDANIYNTCGSFVTSTVVINSAPAGETVSRIVYSVQMQHNDPTDVYAYLLSNGSVGISVWMGEPESNDDDPDNDNLIYLSNRQSHYFDGQLVNQNWRLIAQDCGWLFTGSINSFLIYVYYWTCDPPAVPITPSPADNAINVSRNADLGWADSYGAATYDVYFGTAPSPPYFATTTSSNYALGTLGCLTHYYWKVSAWNQCGAVYGDLWDFTTACCAPSPPASPVPKGTEPVEINVDLDWADTAGALSYDVYFGTTTTPPKVGSTGVSSWGLDALTCNTHYYWYVVAWQGSCATQGPLWDFWTIPPSSVPTGPTPGNHTTGISLDQDLDWADSSPVTGYRLYFGTTNPPPHYADPKDSYYALPTLSPSTKYYWSVTSLNGYCATAGPVWDFTTTCVLPGAAVMPWPADSATGVRLGADLDWGDAAGATSYDVYFGTSSSPPLAGNTATSSYALAPLSCNTRYYWKIVARNACGYTSGPVWTFTTMTAPPAPFGPTPAPGAINQSIDTNLNWDDTPDANSYDVYFGTVSPPPLQGTITTSEYDLPTLAYSTHYYWRIAAVGICGTTAGPVWDWTTQAPGCGLPGTPAGPVPVNHTTGISLTVDLDWADTPGAGSYDVYFGTTASPPLVGTATQSSYDLPSLNCSIKYYWKIVARNNCGVTAGPVWDMTTAPCPRVLMLPLMMR